MTGRREAKRRDNSERVVRAAQELFSTHAFDDVTTAQLAERAGLTTGTFFRYATSKSELLIDAYSNILERCLKDSRALPESTPRKEHILTLVGPIITATEHHAGNVTAFQREVLFGTGQGPNRERAIGLVKDIERELKRIVDGDRLLANTLYSALYMSIVQVAVKTLEPEDLRAEITVKVDYLLA